MGCKLDGGLGLGECAGSLCSVQLLLLGGAVREREFEVLRDELLDVGALHLVGGCDFDDFQDLRKIVSHIVQPFRLSSWFEDRDAIRGYS